jgi:hypothetical protein
MDEERRILEREYISESINDENGRFGNSINAFGFGQGE